MEFLNLTPFAAMAYSAEDTQAREYRVVVAKVTYQLVACTSQPMPGITLCEAHVMDQDGPTLLTEDQFAGEVGTSDVLAESDLAPYKPRCDVLVTGHSYAPAGQRVNKWQSRLRISLPVVVQLPTRPEPPAPLNPMMRLTTEQQAQYQAQLQAHEKEIVRLQDPAQRKPRVLLDKTLTFNGPRLYQAGLLAGWNLLAAQPTSKVPLSYTLAYGGTSQVINPQYGNRPEEPEYLINEVCYTNPLGTGWQHKNYEDAGKRARLKMPEFIRAPQIEYPSHPVDGLEVTKQPAGPDIAGMTRAAQDYRGRPAGFGPIGRAWVPRVQYVGTYDQDWLDNQWPHVPRDFKFDYWNCAPQDQQIEHLHGQAIIELTNLANPQLTSDPHIKVMLPGHRASVLFRLKSGLLISSACVVDTLHIDTDKMQVALVWRCAILDEMQPATAELRYQTDTDKPLISFDEQTQAALHALRGDAHTGDGNLAATAAQTPTLTQNIQGHAHG